MHIKPLKNYHSASNLRQKLGAHTMKTATRIINKINSSSFINSSGFLPVQFVKRGDCPFGRSLPVFGHYREYPPRPQWKRGISKNLRSSYAEKRKSMYRLGKDRNCAGCETLFWSLNVPIFLRHYYGYQPQYNSLTQCSGRNEDLPTKLELSWQMKHDKFVHTK